MKRFKKRTIALVLASVVTVAGSFAAENFKNSLMALNFANSENGAIQMTVETKAAYNGNINPIRKDANTYVLMLPETSNYSSNPDITNISGIESVRINTLPYTTNSKGYTRIVIKTVGNTALSAKSKIYIPQAAPAPALSDNSSQQEEIRPVEEQEEQRPEYREERRPEPEQVQRTPEAERPRRIEPAQERNIEPQTATAEITPIDYGNTKNNNEAFLLVLGIFFVLLTAVFFFMKAKDKLVDIAGEQLDIDVDEPKPEPKKEKKTKTIRKTIKNLDSTYTRPVTMPTSSDFAQPVIKPKTEEMNIVDLDELFQEHSKSKEEEENDALEDFLNGFSFDDEGVNEGVEEEEEEEEEEETFDEELYEKTINNSELEFSEDDVNKINKLLNTEINDGTLRNIEEFAVSNPIKHIPTKEEILEEFVTTYAIERDIIFTAEDIKALQKLISVEIDNDFITDLKTNPERTRQMQLEIEKQKDRPKKATEILTLSVKGMLPDLSEALKLQGGRKIESEVKPATVYYSEGYEVSKLHLNDALPDLSKELNNKDAYKSKPSADIELVDTSYEVEKLNISSNLPDLKEVMANPDKYKEPEPQKVEVDEEALLKNISNVQFKPFYDGTESFEVLNDVPSVSDIQKEFNQFGNFEITEEDLDIQPQVQNEYDDFESLYNNEFFDLDKPEEPQKPVESHRSKASEELLAKIEATKAQREARKAQIKKKKEETIKVEVSADSEVKCILEGQTYIIVSSANFNDNMGCHLAKNEDGYAILGFVDDKLTKLTTYKTLKSEKIQARLSEKIDDNTLRYIVRIGVNKFIVETKNSTISYVMDLC